MNDEEFLLSTVYYDNVTPLCSYKYLTRLEEYLKFSSNFESRMSDNIKETYYIQRIRRDNSK